MRSWSLISKSRSSFNDPRSIFALRYLDDEFSASIIEVTPLDLQMYEGNVGKLNTKQILPNYTTSLQKIECLRWVTLLRDRLLIWNPLFRWISSRLLYESFQVFLYKIVGWACFVATSFMKHRRIPAGIKGPCGVKKHIKNTGPKNTHPNWAVVEDPQTAEWSWVFELVSPLYAWYTYKTIFGSGTHNMLLEKFNVIKSSYIYRLDVAPSQ